MDPISLSERLLNKHPVPWNHNYFENKLKLSVITRTGYLLITLPMEESVKYSNGTHGVIAMPPRSYPTYDTE